ncbi:MAG: hypothetical protein M0Z50_18130 [Planctomycetia bacterium]|nr:hypothetical protein [Planctomycetia bacterium]
MSLKLFPMFHGFGLPMMALAAAMAAGPGFTTAVNANVIAIHNPSFEDNTTAPPGYGAIKDWKSTDTNATGVNGQNGPFADNGKIPNGSQVAFIQSNNGQVEALSQRLSGFIPGKKYVLRFYYNARYATFPAAANPQLVVKLGSSTLTPHGGVSVVPVGTATGHTPYYQARYYYVAKNKTATLHFLNINTAKDRTGTAYSDSTILLDDVSLRTVLTRPIHN